MNLFRRRSSRALVVGSGHRPPLRIDFPQRNKHNNMQRAKSSFLKRHSLVSSFGFVASDLEQTMVHCKDRLKAAGTEGSGQTHLFLHLKQTHVSQWDTCCSLRDAQDHSSPQTPAEKQSTLAESFNHRVPYENGPSGQLLQTQSRCVPLKIWCPYIQWRRRFINMLKMFDPRFVLQSHNGA